MSLPKNQPKLHEFTSHTSRRAWLEDQKSISFNSIQKAFVDDENLPSVHCENLIGATSIPLGVAGLLQLQTQKINQNYQDEDSTFDKKTEEESTPFLPYFIPLATSEGALVASVSRGIKAINNGGGAFCCSQKVGTTRAPVFHTTGLQKSLKFAAWLHKNFEQLSQIAASTSSHLSLIKIEPVVEGRRVFMRCFFDTDEAMGMNMVTIACQKMVHFIESNTEVTCTALSGNMCVDKKASWLNFTTGRGYKVWAETVLTHECIAEVLKSTPQAMLQTWQDKCMHGSALAGSLGFNCHFANVVAAFFLATGQDAAHVVEGSMGVLSVEIVPAGLAVSVYLPCVMLGTVGGGTKLSTQREALNLVGAKTSGELAQVLGGAVLAGEISLLASLSASSLATAHSVLGR